MDRNIFSSRMIIIRNMLLGKALILLVPAAHRKAQPSYMEYHGERLRLNHTGMAIPGSRTLSNISIGASGRGPFTRNSIINNL